MKQIVILIAFVLALGVDAQAQIRPIPAPTTAWNSYTMPYETAGDDTATNTDVITMGVILNNRYDAVVKMVVTKVSGTIGGAAYLQGSPDGTNWFPVENARDYTESLDSPTVANATGTYLWVVPNCPFRYLRAVLNQNTTGVAHPASTIYYRKSED